MARAMLLVLAIGLVPLSAGAAFVRHSSDVRERAQVDLSLTNTASGQTAALANYFDRARSIILLTAQNPAFRDFYAAPGTRETKVRRGGPLVERVEDALAYLQLLYPTSIGEACFIDAAGPENARIVRELRATPAELSPDESANPFFAPTFALRPGQVFQARPYVSPDTGEWVISNSTPIAMPDGRTPAIVHFEVTIESFRRAANQASRFEVAVLDARTGQVVFDSQYPQRVGAPLGRAGERGFAALAGRRGAGVLTLDGKRVAYRSLPTEMGNMNRWLVVAFAPPVGTSLVTGNGIPLLLLAVALLVIAYGVARRWVRVTSDLDESQEGLRASEVRYRELFEHAEEGRKTLAAQNDQLRELDRLKDEFVALVSHELRTPLTSISGYLELITDEPEGFNEDQRQFLAVVQRNADRLQRLVGDLLFVAQVEAQSVRLQETDVDLIAVVRDSADSARLAADEKDIQLVVSTDPVREVRGDEARLAQLLDNLVSNAIKFTPPGGRVSIRVAPGQDRAILLVSDTGVGVPADEQPRLFERFYRTSAASRDAVPGTGLGLAIAKAIVDAHRGTISVTSRENAGTTFRVELPLALGVPAEETPEQARSWI